MIIGITGGIGSGKSTIARELAQRGYTVYDCDREAKRIIAEDAEVRAAIIDLLGPETFINVQRDNVQGTKEVYNTAYVAQRVFAEPALLARLNAIVHPAVKKDILNKSVRCQTQSVLFVESAILYEAGLDSLCDKVVVVDAPEDIRIARVIARDYHNDPSPDHFNKVRARMRAQTPHTGDLLLINDQTLPVSDLVDRILR